ncbi:hypothetical protein QN355_20185, partial [Cryobacterium sp. 10S3]
VTSVQNDATGHYSLTPLPAGEYKLNSSGWQSGIISEWYQDSPDFAAATVVSVANAQARQGVDAQVTVGGKITGTVTKNVDGVITPV